MIVELIFFCSCCNEQHEMMDQVCSKCGVVLCSSKNKKNVTRLSIGEWWRFWNKKNIAVFVPEKDFTSLVEFNLWKKQKIKEYLSGDYHDLYFGKLKYI